MSNFWSRDFTGAPFELFGPSHLAALAVILLINAALFFWQNPSETARRRFRYGLAALLIVDEAILHLWYITNGLWSVQTMLPFHLCAVLVYASSIMLITKSRTIYEVCYFLGIAGAVQAVLTPDLGVYNFPSWRYFSVFISHGSIITAAIYMTVIEGFRPTWRSALRTWVILHLYAIPVFLINLVIGSNYLFINRPPDTPSLIDVLVAVIGPWPWYLIGLEAIAIVLFVVVYLPFAIKDWRTTPAVAADAGGGA
ncbi:MAG: TIGR02206 family membrane protein [Anaerolineae bacterium]